MTTHGAGDHRVAKAGRRRWPYHGGALSPSQALSARLGVLHPETAAEARGASTTAVVGTGVVARETGNDGTTTTEVAGRGHMYGRDAATDLDHRARDALHQGDCGGGGTCCDAAVNRDRRGEGQSTCIWLK